MPYLTKERKDVISTPETCGELNYMVTELIIAYMKNNGLSYQTCNDIVGALSNASDEFKRRIQHPYEDYKIQENGDVYDPSCILFKEIK